MTWRRGEAGSTLIDRPKDAPVPDFTNGKERAKALGGPGGKQQFRPLGKGGHVAMWKVVRRWKSNGMGWNQGDLSNIQATGY